MNWTLKSLVDIQAGHPFRGSVPFVEDGQAYALQMRDLSPSGEVNWEGLVRTEVDTRKAVQWLESGDVVFVARGTRNYAVCLREVPKPVVCSPNFYLLRIKSHALLPEFLAWQLSIRRPVLEALPLAVPPLHQQQIIVSLAEAAAQEERQLQTLIRNRQQQLDALALALFTNEPEQN